MNNTERADAASVALTRFAQFTNALGEERETLIVDLLADLRHMCARESWDYDRLDLAASNHYAEEITEARQAALNGQRWKVWQLAPDAAEYGSDAGRWLVVTEDGEHELTGVMDEAAALAIVELHNAALEQKVST